MTTEEEEEYVTETDQGTRKARAAMPPRKSSLSQEEAKKAVLPHASSFEDSSRPSYETTSPQPSEDTDTPRASLDPHPSLDGYQSTFRSSTNVSPTLLPHTRLTIPTSSVHPNSLGREVLSFIVCISVRPPNAQPVSWNVAKPLSAFIDLDTRIKYRSGKGRKEWKGLVAPLPEGRAWKDFAPSKIDQRRRAIEAYLQSLLIAPISDKTDLCEFLSSDVAQTRVEGARKEGYLTKKGKNFRGWKRRFFVLEGPLMKYYETVSKPRDQADSIARRTAAWLHQHFKRSDRTAEPPFRIR